MINLYQGDCMEAMESMDDNQYDLAIVDPPYGIEINNSIGRRKGNKKSNYKKINWDNKPPDYIYFEQLKRVSKNQIIWGGNYFANLLPPSKCWLVWDKWISDEMSFSQCELAYTSFDGSIRKFRKVNNGNNRINIHPTAKPVALYKWLLKNYAKEGDKILDTHGGSMSIALACHDMKFSLDLWELDEDYYKAGVKRYNQHIRQLQLF